ncbi:hypothetical protein DVH05_019255 [Phytophthora capsici]|nr:hypothetical protein DVH05_019255 [Phytophthora capsici]
MSDLLNANADASRDQEGTPMPSGNATGTSVAVGEPDQAVPTVADASVDPEPLTQAEQEEDLQGGATPTTPSPVDEFGLDYDKFVAEQDRLPWMKALKAFLQSGALALDPQLRASVLKMSPHFLIRNGVLMRRVLLGARAGPARTISVPAVLLSFIETVLHYCHADIFSAHLGKMKTADKVRRHAYWPGWKKDVVEYVRGCSICGGGKGHRPWRAGLVQRMPTYQALFHC